MFEKLISINIYKKYRFKCCTSYIILGARLNQTSILEKLQELQDSLNMMKVLSNDLTLVEKELSSTKDLADR